MTTLNSSCTFLSRLAAAGALCAAAVVAPAANAGNADAVMTLGVTPSPEVSISRDPVSVGPNYRVAYTVSIFNPSNSSKNFRFVGNLTTDPDAGNQSAPPTDFKSSRSDCSLTSTNPVQIVCPKLEIAKRTTIRFRFEFRTPTAGSQLNLLANLFFPASNGTLTASGTQSVLLVDKPQVDYILGFDTFVPATGGTFFSGDAGNLAGSPGGVATEVDPFTTTVVIPPIGFATTASVREKQQGELGGCATIYQNEGCFESDITIPSASGALKGMQIILRIDRTRHIVDPSLSIDRARIGYSKDSSSPPVEVPNCSASVVAAPGKPCIRTRKDYGFGVPEAWQFDWEFQIDAVDNGRYVNL